MNDDVDTDVAPWALRPVVVVAGDGVSTSFFALDVAAEKPEDYPIVAEILLASDGYRN